MEQPTAMSLYVVERTTGKRVKEIPVTDEADAETKFRALSASIGTADSPFNWADHCIDADEVWLEPRHPLDE